jgi:hypothetical protein
MPANSEIADGSAPASQMDLVSTGRESGKPSVVIVAAILAICAPVTTAVWGGVQKSKELALEDRKHAAEAEMEKIKLNHSIQIDFLDRLKNDDERLRTLRMVEMTSDDAKMVSWAREEVSHIDQTLEDLNERIKQRRSDLQDAKERIDRAKNDKRISVGLLNELYKNAIKEQRKLTALLSERERRMDSRLDGAFDFGTDDAIVGTDKADSSAKPAAPKVSGHSP